MLICEDSPSNVLHSQQVTTLEEAFLKLSRHLPPITNKEKESVSKYNIKIHLLHQS